MRRVVGTLVLTLLIVSVACNPLPPCRKGRRCPKPTPPPTTVLRRAQAAKTAVFAGLGAWVDVYDWSPTFSPSATWGLDDVDRIAAAGVQVLYIQSAKATRPEDLLDPDKFKAIVDRAHAKGLRVVSWFLPANLDPKSDVIKLVAPLKFGVDGIAMDIESTDQKDLTARNNALVLESLFVRFFLPDVAMAAIVLPPVVTDVLNLNYWPNFPWTKIKDYFDVWMPMGYWTNRTTASGWRDGEKYTNENIDRVRANLGDPNAPIHPVGGINDKATIDEINGFVRSAQSRGAIGGSLYDDRTSNPDQYAALQPLRR